MSPVEVNACGLPTPTVFWWRLPTALSMFEIPARNAYDVNTGGKARRKGEFVRLEPGLINVSASAMWSSA